MGLGVFGIMLFDLLSEIDEGWKGSESDEWHLGFEAVELPAFAGNGQLPVGRCLCGGCRR